LGHRRRSKPHLFELERRREFSVRAGERAVRQRPLAELAFVGLASQDSGHLFLVKLFRFGHQLFNTDLTAKRAAKTDGYDDVSHCLILTAPEQP